jgi:hypothetical protein
MYPDLCGTLDDEELVAEGLDGEDGDRETIEEAESLDGDGKGTPTTLLGWLDALDVGFADAEDELDDDAEALELDEEPLAELLSTEPESLPTTAEGLLVAATAAAAEPPDRVNGYATATATTAATTAAAPVRTTARRRFGDEGADSAAGSSEPAMVKESSRDEVFSTSTAGSSATPAVNESCGTARLDVPTISPAAPCSASPLRPAAPTASAAPVVAPAPAAPAARACPIAAAAPAAPVAAAAPEAPASPAA